MPRHRPAWRLQPSENPGAKPMLDALMLVTILALFAVAIGYGYACERL